MIMTKLIINGDDKGHAFTLGIIWQFPFYRMIRQFLLSRLPSSPPHPHPSLASFFLRGGWCLGTSKRIIYAHSVTTGACIQHPAFSEPASPSLKLKRDAPFLVFRFNMRFFPLSLPFPTITAPTKVFPRADCGTWEICAASHDPLQGLNSSSLLVFQECV